jgi:hypothetical protein
VSRHAELRAELARLKEQAIADLNGGLEAAAARESSLAGQADYLGARLAGLREADRAGRGVLVLALQALKARLSGAAVEEFRAEMARVAEGLVRREREALDRLLVLHEVIKTLENHMLDAQEAAALADQLLSAPVPPAGVAPAPPEWLVRERLELAGRVPPAASGKVVAP